MTVSCSQNGNTKIKMQFFGSPLTVYCDKSLTSRSIQRLPCVDKNGPLRPYQMVMELANDALTMKYCEDRERRRERKGKTVSFKRVCHRNEHLLKIPARYDYNLHRKICGRNAYDDNNYRKIIKADEGEAYAVRSLKFGPFSCRWFNMRYANQV